MFGAISYFLLNFSYCLINSKHHYILNKKQLFFSGETVFYSKNLEFKYFIFYDITENIFLNYPTLTNH